VGDQGGLDHADRLALGTLNLEGTAKGVSAAQAAELLPLWQVVHSGLLQGDAERDALIAQIESKMSDAQLTAIEDMALTTEDLKAWMEQQGIEMPAPQARGQDGPPAGIVDMSEEERDAMRQDMQNTTAEERATRMAEMGVARPEGHARGAPPGRGPGRSSMILGSLVELLTVRATG
jgi:hypothetical protein